MIFKLVNLFIVISIILVLADCTNKELNGEIILYNISIVDVENQKILPNKNVVINGNKIADITSFSKNQKLNAKQLVEGTGKFLIPGLWDMHSHYITTKNSTHNLNLMIANGVLGTRECWGNLSRRDSIIKNISIHPRIITSGHVLDGAFSLLRGSIRLNSPDHVTQIVDSLHIAGADFIKVYDNLSEDTFTAIANKCKELGISFAGHTPDELSAENISDMGIKSIEHLNGIFESCSSDHQKISNYKTEFKNLIMKNQIGPALQVFTSELELTSKTYDIEKAKSLAQILKKNQTFITPTLILLKNNWFRNDPAYKENINLKYVPQEMITRWYPENDFPAQIYTEDTWKAGQNLYSLSKKITNQFSEIGVQILAGSDCGVAYVVPGFSLHEELALLVESGLSNGDALKTATVNPARYLSASDSLGSIGINKIADLVLLGKNPLEDINNTKEIQAIIRDGNYLSKLELETLLKSVENKFSNN